MLAVAALLAPAACQPAPSTARPRTPVRIVSTAPSVTEIVFALGLGDAVVGVSDHCTFPKEASGRATVGPYLQPSVERILALRPDLALLDDVQADAARALEAAALPTLRLGLRSLADVRSAILRVGGVTARGAEAAALVARLDREIAAAPRLASRERVLLVIGRDPGTLRNLYAAAPGSFAGELLRIAGGKNALADAATPYPKVAVETIIARAPDVIVEIPTAGVDAAAARRDWAALASVPAVRTGRVHLTTDQLLTTPGPRAAQALARLVETIERPGQSPVVPAGELPAGN
ncbi:MAG: helical backbone metal receptor [Myxococcota bacterium]